jgi:hypothetical protein
MTTLLALVESELKSLIFDRYTQNALGHTNARGEFVKVAVSDRTERVMECMNQFCHIYVVNEPTAQTLRLSNLTHFSQFRLQP